MLAALATPVQRAAQAAPRTARQAPLRAPPRRMRRSHARRGPQNERGHASRSKACALLIVPLAGVPSPLIRRRRSTRSARTKSRAAAALSARAGARRRADGRGRRAKAPRRTTRTASAASPRCLRLAAPPATSAGHVGVLIASTRSHAAERRACGAESGARGLNASHALLLSVSRAPRVATREQQPARRRHSNLRPHAGQTHRGRRRSSGATWRADARRTFFSPSLTRVRSAPSRPPRAVKRRCGSLGVCLPAQGGRGGARVSSRSFELWQMKI